MKMSVDVVWRWVGSIVDVIVDEVNAFFSSGGVCVCSAWYLDRVV